MLPKTYLSAKLLGGKVEIIENTFPKPDGTTVLIKVRLSGICRADVKEVNRSRDIPSDRGPLFGHEINGEVVFPGNMGLNPGQMVAFNPNVTSNRTTGFAQYMIIRGSNDELKEAIIPLPRGIPIRKTILAEPLACIVHCIDQFQKNTGLKTLKGMKIAIIGAGNAGMIFGLLAKNDGAVVSLFNISDGRIEFAKKQKLFKDKELHPLSEHENFSSSFDMVFVSPTIITEDILRIAFGLTADKGCLLLYGGTRKNDRFLDTNIDIDIIRRKELIQKTEFKRKRVSLAGGYGCTSGDFIKGFRLMGNLPLEKFISKEIVFRDFPKLIMDMASGKSDYPGKVIVKY